jgi:O-acetylserine/cysteine efflux transporter
MKLRDVFLALITVLILGSSFVAVKLGVREIPPLLLTSLRFFFAAVPAIFLVNRPKVPVRFVVSFGLTMGAVQFALLYTAIKLGMPAGLSSVVLQLQVFFTVLLAYVCFGEKPLLLEIAGGLVALVGVALIGALENSAVELVPFALVSASALAWAAGSIIIKAARPSDTFAFVVWSCPVSPLPLLVLSFLVEGRAPVMAALLHPSMASAGAVVFLAYATTLGALGLWVKLLNRYPAAAVAPFGLLVPVFAILSTHLLLGEQITRIEIVGSGLVLAGLILSVSAASFGGLRRQVWARP